MVPISRKSEFLDGLVKKAYSISRIGPPGKKHDPFKGRVDGDVWKIVGKKLVRRKSRRGEIST